jgi:hypothetical protein
MCSSSHSLAATKNRVLFAYATDKNFSHISTTGNLLGVQGKKITRPVFVFDANFGRSEFHQALATAKAHGVEADQMIVYAPTATYSGRSILFQKLEDMLARQH